MKSLFAFSLFFILGNSYSQDTLYLTVHGLGHEKYVLNDDGTFNYSSNLCGSSFVSYGTYRKNAFGYRFKYDTTKCPSPSIKEVSQEVVNDSITLLFFNMVDSTRQPFWGPFAIGEQTYRCNSDSITIPKRDLKTNTLIIRDFNDSLVFNFSAASSELQIYISPSGMAYNCGIHDIQKLKKTKFGYLHKFNVYDEIREKPSAKGVKRVVRLYYQLRE